MSRYLTSILCALCATTLVCAQPDSTYLSAVMGVSPDAMHNTALRQHVLYGDAAWTSDLTDPAHLEQMYGLVGAGMDGWHTWAKQGEMGLLLGGPRPHQKAEAIWAFRSPPGSTFKAGKVRVSLTVPEAWGEAETPPSVSLVGELKLGGGGQYFRTFSGVTSSPLVSASVRPKAKSPQTLTLDVPGGIDIFHVVVTRPAKAPAKAPVVVHSVEVQVQMQRDSVLRLSLSQEEPFWNVGDDVRVELRTVGRTPIESAGVNIKRLDAQGYQSVAQQSIDLSDGSGAVDMQPLGAGYFLLEAYASTAPEQILDRREVVVLRAQDPEITHETSMFGVKQGDREPKLAQSIGMKWSGASFLWAWSQAGPDAPIKIDDEWVNAVREHGMEPKAMIYTSPKWANGGGNGPTPPTEEHYPDWRRFNREVAKAMGDRVTWYEAWNEPNNGRQLVFKGPVQERVALAKTLQRHQYAGLLEGNPKAKLIGGDFAGLYAHWVEYWLKDDSAAGAQHAMSGHPYCRTSRDVHWAHKFPPEPDLVPRLLAFREMMDQYGAADQPTFWTEFGWDTAEVSEAEQARWIVRQFVILHAYQVKLKTKAAFVFTCNPRFDYSIVRYHSAVDPWQHRMRPAAGAIATTASLLAGSELVARHHDHPSAIRLYEFKNAGRRILAAWATESAETYELSLPIAGPIRARQVNLLGDEQPLELAPDQPIALPTNNDPIFLILPAE